MGKKHARPTGFEKVTCSLCKKEAVAKKGKPHRWCKGSNKQLRKSPTMRGTWS